MNQYIQLENEFYEELDVLEEEDHEDIENVNFEDEEPELSSLAPITWQILESENRENIRAMTNFYRQEYLDLIAILNPVFAQNKTRGKKLISDHDGFLVLLTWFKHYETFGKLCVTFNVTQSVIQAKISRMLKIVSGPLIQHFIRKIYREEQVRTNIRFPDFGEAVAVIDCTVQKINRPKMSFQEAKGFFSDKHKMYCLKKETVHAPNGEAMYVSNYYLGAVHDFTIFKDSIEKHKDYLTKTPEEVPINDEGMGVDDFPTEWGMMMDKGYTGAQDLLRAIMPKKKPIRGRLTLEEKELNRLIASNRIIIENFYGRLKTLWKILFEQYRNEHNIYDLIFDTCVALTNFNISINPLRDEESLTYRIILREYTREEERKKSRQQEMNRNYRERLTRRRGLNN